MWVDDGGDGPIPIFRKEIGRRYLYVRGTGEYWAYRRSEGAPDHTRTGVLTAEEDEEIAADLHYRDWTELPGTHSGTGGSTLYLHDGFHTVACFAACPDADARIHEARYESDQWIDRLWERGEPVAEGVHIVAQPHSGFYAVPWPLEWPVAEVLTTAEPFYQLGSSALVEDVDDARALRELFAAQDPVDNIEDGLQVRDAEDSTYEIAIRDALPIENEIGLVEFPTPCDDAYECSPGGVCEAGWCAYAE